MVKLIYDFKQGRDTVSNTANAKTGTSIYQSADTRTIYCASSILYTQILSWPVQSITAKTGIMRICW